MNHRRKLQIFLFVLAMIVLVASLWSWRSTGNLGPIGVATILFVAAAVLGRRRSSGDA